MGKYKHPRRGELLEIFGDTITPIMANKYRIKALRADLKPLKEEYSNLLAKRIKTSSSNLKLIYKVAQETYIQPKIDKIEKQIYFLKRQNKFLKQPAQKQQYQPLNVDAAKDYSILDILQGAGIQLINNKFAIRDEKTPSCYYYKNSNSYYDFGSSKGGDSIDLYMEIYNVTFQEAVKNLCG